MHSQCHSLTIVKYNKFDFRITILKILPNIGFLIGWQWVEIKTLESITITKSLIHLQKFKGDIKKVIAERQDMAMNYR